MPLNPLRAAILLLSLAIPLCADDRKETEGMASRAFERINISSQSDKGLMVKADIRILGLQAGELKASYSRAMARGGRVWTEVSAPGYKEATIAADGKFWTAQSSEPTPARIIQLNDALAPLFSAEAINLPGEKTKIRSGKVRGMEARCVETEAHSQKHCFDPDQGLLVQAGNEYWRTEYSDFQPVGTKVFPRRFKVYQQNELIIDATLHVENNAVLPEKKFIAGSGFVQVEIPASCSSLPPRVVKMGRPDFYARAVYPMTAKQDRRMGMVVYYAKIGRDGAVKSLVLVKSAGADLDKAAYDAASQWRYKPHIHCGRPVEVNTLISINFSIGG